jgi:hypothetical protein
MFVAEVIAPAREAPRGLPRVWALCDHMIDYTERQVFPGGCFFAATSFEFNNRPGPVRDRIAEMMASWLSYLEHAVEQAQEAGEIHAGVERARDRVRARLARAGSEREVPALPRATRVRRGAARGARPHREPPPRPRGLSTEARMVSSEHGLRPEADGWFVLSAREAEWQHAERHGSVCGFEGYEPFAEFGVSLNVLHPGQSKGLYHAENAQEDFLVLAGECVLHRRRSGADA